MTLKIALPILALALLAAAPALAAEKFIDDCTVAERDKPSLDRAKLPSARFRMVVSDIGFEKGPNNENIRLKLRHGEETATLKSGAGLRVTLGWCENYSNGYEFRLTGDTTPVSDSRYWLRKASALTAEVAPANREGFVRLPQLSAVLARRASERVNLVEGLEGDLTETHRYRVTVSRQGKTTLVTVLYIVAL